MRYFFDTEFIERGAKYPVTLISIGIVADDGREYYAVSSEFNEADAGAWVAQNVLPHLGDVERLPLGEVAADIERFVGDDPEFWAYYCSYDWVVLCQCFGTMMDLPKGFPMYCNDLKVELERHGNPRLPEQTSTEHNALADARWTKDSFYWLMSRVPGTRGY